MPGRAAAAVLILLLALGAAEASGRDLLQVVEPLAQPTTAAATCSTVPSCKSLANKCGKSLTATTKKLTAANKKAAANSKALAAKTKQYNVVNAELAAAKSTAVDYLTQWGVGKGDAVTGADLVNRLVANIDQSPAYKNKQTELLAVQADLDQANLNIGTLTQDKADLTQQVSDLGKQVTTLTGQVTTLTGQVNTLSGQIASVNNCMKNLVTAATCILGLSL